MFFLDKIMKKYKITPVRIAFGAMIILACAIAVFFVRFRNYIAFGQSIDMSVVQMWRVYGAPSSEKEWMFSLIVESENGNWSKVAKLTKRDRHLQIGTYYHNLAMAKQGRLSQELLNYYQPMEEGLLLPIKQGTRPLFVSCAGEAWYQIGEIIMAEHSTMLGLAFTATQSGERFYRRLAQIAYINGDSCSVKKYENLLGSPIDDSWKEILPFAPKTDTVFLAGQNRLALKNLLESNPNNIMAYEYLLCYDLLRKDIASFIEDYVPGKVKSNLYDEAVLLYLAGDRLLSEVMMDKYGVSKQVYNNFRAYGDAYMISNANKQKMKEIYGNTYWYYFHFAKKDE